MAEQKPPSMVVPALLAVVGGTFLVRALHRPMRAFLVRGRIARCPTVEGGVCRPETVLESTPGDRVYAPTRMLAVSVGDDSVVVLSDGAPAFTTVRGIVPSVALNDSIPAGGEIGVVEQNQITVETHLLLPNREAPQPTPTSAWVASRGCRLIERDEGSSGWCAGGRTIVVPSEVASACSFVSPGAPPYSLLPVSIDIER